MVKTLDLRLSRRGFDSQSFLFQLTTLGKMYIHTHCALVIKQYQLTLVRGWCPITGKVTAGLASHWPCITDTSGSSTGLRPKDGRWAPGLHSGKEYAMSHYISFITLGLHCFAVDGHGACRSPRADSAPLRYDDVRGNDGAVTWRRRWRHADDVVAGAPCLGVVRLVHGGARVAVFRHAQVVSTHRQTTRQQMSVICHFNPPL